MKSTTSEYIAITALTLTIGLQGLLWISNMIINTFANIL